MQKTLESGFSKEEREIAGEVEWAAIFIAVADGRKGLRRTTHRSFGNLITRMS